MKQNSMEIQQKYIFSIAVANCWSFARICNWEKCVGVCVGSVPFIGSTVRSVWVKNSIYPIRYKGRKAVHLCAVLKKQNKQNPLQCKGLHCVLAAGE